VRKALIAAIVALAFATGSQPLSAQDYPSRPVRVVIPFAPGAGTDLLGRLVAGELSQRLAQIVAGGMGELAEIAVGLSQLFGLPSERFLGVFPAGDVGEGDDASEQFGGVVPERAGADQDGAPFAARPNKRGFHSADWPAFVRGAEDLLGSGGGERECLVEMGAEDGSAGQILGGLAGTRNDPLGLDHHDRFAGLIENQP